MPRFAAMRKPIIAANWKMNMTPGETDEFLKPFKTLIPAKCTVDVVVAPTFVSLAAASEHLKDDVNIKLAAQNMSQHDSGAYTGETSAMMLKELYVSHVILGHSERRALYGEDDALINAKLKKTYEANLKPIFCIGETLEEREGGKIEEVLGTQIRGGFDGIDAKNAGDTVVAYEPVWAIGTGVTASPEQAQEAHAFCRSVLADIYDTDTAAKIRIQYGGSVKPTNMGELISQEDIDGALVGGASLDYRSFSEIVKAAIEWFEA